MPSKTARRLRCPLALVALLVALFAYAPAAGAATFTVTTTADSGPGSLRQAITDANAGDGHTIAFAIPGSGPHVIAPASGLPLLSRDDTIVDGWRARASASWGSEPRSGGCRSLAAGRQSR